MNLSLILSCMEKPAKTCVHVISRFVLLTNLQKSKKKKLFCIVVMGWCVRKFKEESEFNQFGNKAVLECGKSQVL